MTEFPHDICKEQAVNIAVLKERVDKMDDFVTEIRDNHLPHIYESINELKVQMAYYVGGGTAIVVVVQFIVALMFWWRLVENVCFEY